MFAINTYEEIEQRERLLNEQHIIILLFVKPDSPNAQSIIAEFDYIYYNSDKYCSIYAVGYSNNPHNQKRHYKEVPGIDGALWYFSMRDFVDFKKKLEPRINWQYSGENEMIILQSNPSGPNILNFTNYFAVNIDYGLREGYLDSFNRFMESLVRSSQSEVTAASAMSKTRFHQIKKRNILALAIESSKKTPLPIKTILKDASFYRTSAKYLQVK